MCLLIGGVFLGRFNAEVLGLIFPAYGKGWARCSLRALSIPFSASSINGGFASMGDSGQLAQWHLYFLLTAPAFHAPVLASLRLHALHLVLRFPQDAPRVLQVYLLIRQPCCKTKDPVGSI